METIDDGTLITLELIREDLATNPPGTNVLDMKRYPAYRAPFELVYLLERLEIAERPCWKKLLCVIRDFVHWGMATRGDHAWPPH